MVGRLVIRTLTGLMGWSANDPDP